MVLSAPHTQQYQRDYLDNLYVKRNEVIDWCSKCIVIFRLCSKPKDLLDKQFWEGNQKSPSS